MFPPLSAPHCFSSRIFHSGCYCLTTVVDCPSNFCRIILEMQGKQVISLNTLSSQRHTFFRLFRNSVKPRSSNLLTAFRNTSLWVFNVGHDQSSLGRQNPIIKCILQVSRYIKRFLNRLMLKEVT